MPVISSSLGFFFEISQGKWLNVKVIAKLAYLFYFGKFLRKNVIYHANAKVKV